MLATLYTRGLSTIGIFVKERQVAHALALMGWDNAALCMSQKSRAKSLPHVYPGYAIPPRDRLSITAKSVSGALTELLFRVTVCDDVASCLLSHLLKKVRAHHGWVGPRAETRRTPNITESD